MVSSSLAPKWPILVHFCGMDHQKSFFLLILGPFLLEAVEASQCYFFENWFIKLKCPTLLKPLATVIQQNYWSFYPSEPFTFTRYAMRHPVCGCKWRNLRWLWVLFEIQIHVGEICLKQICVNQGVDVIKTITDPIIEVGVAHCLSNKKVESILGTYFCLLYRCTYYVLLQRLQLITSCPLIYDVYLMYIVTWVKLPMVWPINEGLLLTF